MDVNELLKYMKCHILDHWCIKPLLTKPQMWDAMRSPFKANHRKDSMFIMAISKWLQYNFVLEINNNMFVSRLMNHTITYKGQTETNNKSLQGLTLTVVRLPGASEMRLRASENGTQLVRSGKWKWFCDMFNSRRVKWLILNYSVLEVAANFT
jgi:hypothetical protein